MLTSFRANLAPCNNFGNALNVLRSTAKLTLPVQPTLNTWPTRFGKLVVNMVSREAAEAVFDEVDKITAAWPPFEFPHPQVPVRWAPGQGLDELYEWHADDAFHLSGLPGGWAIPHCAHVFFKLPQDPRAALEQQQLPHFERQRPEAEVWVDEYQSGLEAGLDDGTDGAMAVLSAGVGPFGAFPGPPRLLHAGRLENGSNPFEALPGPPPMPPVGRLESGGNHHKEQARGVHLKRPYDESHDQVSCSITFTPHPVCTLTSQLDTFENIWF